MLISNIKNNKKISVILFVLSIFFFCAVLVVFLNGCSNMVLMNPKGQVGEKQRSLIITVFSLMSIIVIPAIIMSFIFVVKYRASNIKSTYNPDWSHSNKIELVVWTIPVIIIIILAIITWKTTYELDPKKPIIHNIHPIIIEVIALDWKWLFIYPEQKIATINEIFFPINVPIKFHITSNSVMNSFFIPDLGSQIYAMVGMQTTLNLIANKPGIYKGFSSNFSGNGFSGMKFTAVATLNKNKFYQWVKKVKSSLNILNTIESYERLALPSEFHPVQYFSNVKSRLFYYVLNKYMNKKENKIVTIKK